MATPPTTKPVVESSTVAATTSAPLKHPEVTTPKAAVAEQVKMAEDKQRETEQTYVPPPPIKFAGKQTDSDKADKLHHLWNSISQYVPVQEKGNIIQSWKNTLGW